MTIWLLALVLMASLAGLGYRQGAIRVAISFVGILVGALLAVPLGRLVGKLLVIFGIKDPLFTWALGPVIVFILVSLAFKAAAVAVHHKADVYYKYHAGDLRLALWERLNHRLGLCVGLLNGMAYLILLSFVIYLPTYLTLQVATSDQDPRWMRLLNTLGRDLRASGLDKVARAIDRVPQLDYDMADFAAKLYYNPLIQARLSTYPGLLELADRPEFQGVAGDKEFMESWARMDPVMKLMERLQSIRDNPELLRATWKALAPDLVDLDTYLRTGQSPKYDPQPILGRWQFDLNGTMNLFRRAKPTMPSSEMQKWKKWMLGAFDKTGVVARPDNHVSLRNLPSIKQMGVSSAAPQTYEGEWKDLDGGKYALSFSGLDLAATVEAERLTIKTEGMELAFERQE